MTASGGMELGEKRLRAADVDRPFHGVRSVALDLSTVIGRCRAYRPRLRAGEVFSHTTAAQLYGIPLPSGREREHVLHVSSADAGRPRTRGVVGHRIRDLEVAMFAGLPISSPAETWRMLAGMLELDDLVAAGDAFVSGERIARGLRSQALCTIVELRTAIARHGRRRGARALLEAVELVRAGVDSRRETHTRLAIIRSGLPEPKIAPPVIVAGGVVLHPDLAYPELRIAIEYEGEEHRLDARRWRDDISRRRALEAAGWVVLRVTIEDLRRPSGFLADLTAVVRTRTHHALSS